jgi:hypothetical protein
MVEPKPADQREIRRESGLQACHGKSPGDGAFSIGPDSPVTRHGSLSAKEFAAVYLEPLGPGTRALPGVAPNRTLDVTGGRGRSQAGLNG